MLRGVFVMKHIGHVKKYPSRDNVIFLRRQQEKFNLKTVILHKYSSQHDLYVSSQILLST
jgi:hypothetical protein